MPEESEVRAFYTGKNFFITGGTGFVGLCLIEKILRSIPDVGKVYLLMRPKKGKEISQRLEEFPKNLVFEKLLETNTTDVFKKLIPISGDVGQENLGLSAQDRQVLVDNVDVVIHSAATLDFQENLRPTVNINLLGTRRVMELCQQMKNLKVMVHVSSAYVNSYLTEAHEKVYEAPEDAEKVISLVGTLTDESLDQIEPKLLKTHPNTYTFTKHLAEHEVVKCSDKFPCTIVRPTMIVAAWKEPVPGWTCSKVGPQGFMMGAGKGVVRRLPLAKENIADYIPVDVVVNELLVAGWQAAKAKSGLSVYHCSSSTCRPFAWAMLENQVNGMLHKYPLKGAVWYPHLKFVPSLLLFRISAIFVHFFPAILLDMLLRLTGGRPILFRLHKNVWSSLGRLERFIFAEWKFHNPNTVELARKLNQTDRELFNIDISTLHWEEYFTKLLLGVRRYLNREEEKTLPAARSKDSMLLVFHIIWQILVIALLWYVVACVTGLTMTQSAWAAPAIYILYTCL
ncbi:putative fatty acyl-CoA reductase CG8306 [Pectinophora gossypiella]|uniref:putative fatty acyl-CoA reductase CG8306 n=1 Tax=Pectinophora gossypiella TaxID=13191 RepID=UPI00214E41CA|nr:putative fatty acyl-CoA reductase CG8306 [Pectinophora gossypiella]XP_049883837.1 putative fatty acyl-CoA reductase CG8306 [Pectinophora gossypiella]XP_049883838.1 putative fatty acyl-CoA reductase CG8306 [Pectinophora gossypiella]XP_049883839.1 putative fatty acyl-CoA reductase CG8306 [Pectinophora gossypiella]